METIRGKTSHSLDCNGLYGRLKNYEQVVLDLGTGDGRYVRSLAEKHPDWFIIGADACRENLREHSRANLTNALFVIASAQALPSELDGLMSHVAINFPWGSLLQSLLAADAGLMNGLSSVAKPRTQIDIRINGGALAEAGTSLERGAQTIYDNLNRCGWILQTPSQMSRQALQTFPTTWAKRLAYGRDPRAVMLTGSLGISVDYTARPTVLVR